MRLERVVSWQGECHAASADSETRVVACRERFLQFFHRHVEAFIADAFAAAELEVFVADGVIEAPRLVLGLQTDNKK